MGIKLAKSEYDVIIGKKSASIIDKNTTKGNLFFENKFVDIFFAIELEDLKNVCKENNIKYLIE